MKNDILFKAIINAMAVSAVKSCTDRVVIIDEAGTKELYLLFKPIIENLCRRYYVKKSGMDIYIMHREATLAFFDAVITYTPENGVDFHVHACSVITGHMTRITRNSRYCVETASGNSLSDCDKCKAISEDEGGEHERWD